MNGAGLREQVQAIDWYHTIDLGNGVVTPGREDTGARLKRLALPDDLAGQTVLDVGAWDGFYSFEAERRGASRVLATDSFIWRGQGWGSKRGFELARRTLGSRVEDMEIDALELSGERPGVFDLVLFLGVLYHVRHPMLALERVAEVTGRQVIVETHVDLRGMPRPALAFYPGGEVFGDESTWWGPNPAAVVAMLKAVGFREVRQIHAHSQVRRALRQPHSLFRGAWKGGEPFRQGRVVYHAFK